jgi:hypothetical protein
MITRVFCFGTEVISISGNLLRLIDILILESWLVDDSCSGRVKIPGDWKYPIEATRIIWG